MRSNSCRSSTTSINTLSVMDLNSTQKEPFPRSEFMLALNLDILNSGRSPYADSPLSSLNRLIILNILHS